MRTAPRSSLRSASSIWIPGSFTSGSTHPIFQVIDQDGITYGVSPHWTGSFDVGGYRDDLTIGGRFFGGNNKALQFVNVAGNRGALHGQRAAGRL